MPLGLGAYLTLQSDHKYYLNPSNKFCTNLITSPNFLEPGKISKGFIPPKKQKITLREGMSLKLNNFNTTTSCNAMTNPSKKI